MVHPEQALGPGAVLAGRVAVVTGGGRGAGAAIALHLARAGAAVAIAARTAAQTTAVAEAVRKHGARAMAVTVDVAVPASVTALADQVHAAFGRADILINAAGIASAAPIMTQSLDEWTRMFAVNATGPLLCMQAFLPDMLARGWGRIVNIASTAGLTAGRYIAAYAASKHALVGLTRAAAAEVAAHGVTINAICPGYLDTDMTADTLQRIMAATGRTREQALAAVLESTPQRRLIDPREVAAMALHLCTEEARGITGASLVIDGGETRR